MLRLLYGIACENAIVADNGVTSLIGVLERIDATLPASAPEKLLLPMKWFFVTLWTRDKNPFPAPTRYEQEIRVTTSDGDEVNKTIQPFTVSNNHVNFRNVTEFQAFPLSPGGQVDVHVRIRKTGKGKWSVPTQYTIRSGRTILEVPVNADN